MINLILFGVADKLSGWSGKEPSERMKRIVNNISDGTGIDGGWWWSRKPGVPYVKDQTKMDEAKRLLEEEVLERSRKIWDEMEKEGE